MSQTEITVSLRKQEIVASITALGGKSKFVVPDMPDIIILLEKEFRNQTASVRRFAEIIESNTVIAGELLTIVKSPLYQRQMKPDADEIVSVHDAVKFLGLKKTFQLSMAAAIHCLPQQSPLFRVVIDHCADIALCCAEIATHVQGISMEEAFLFGLFCNGGAIGMATLLESRYEPYWDKSVSHPISCVEQELSAFNARHDYLGVIAARQWGFGETAEEQDMILAIQEHHNVDEVKNFKQERIRLLVAMGMLAETIVHGINGSTAANSPENTLMKETALDVLCLPDAVISEVRRVTLSRLIFS